MANWPTKAVTDSIMEKIEKHLVKLRSTRTHVLCLFSQAVVG